MPCHNQLSKETSYTAYNSIPTLNPRLLPPSPCSITWTLRPSSTSSSSLTRVSGKSPYLVSMATTTPRLRYTPCLPHTPQWRARGARG